MLTTWGGWDRDDGDLDGSLQVADVAVDEVGALCEVVSIHAPTRGATAAR